MHKDPDDFQWTINIDIDDDGDFDYTWAIAGSTAIIDGNYPIGTIECSDS
ncbi:MAG: hypothetical protein R2771_07375 [Saprospiraceae bacterium]